jgi:hypothetical protein
MDEKRYWHLTANIWFATSLILSALEKVLPAILTVILAWVCLVFGVLAPEEQKD